MGILMSYTDEFHKEAYFGDLYQLTVDEAANKIHEGLWNPKQATVKDIKDAIIADIKKGSLKLVRGSVNIIGKYNNNPAILDAHGLCGWAERNGLELESNGEWHSYMMDEAELSAALDDKLVALRALQRSGKTVSEIMDSEVVKAENEQDRLITYFVENNELKSQSAKHLQLSEKSKEIKSLYKIVSAMAADGYGYRWEDKKSSIPNEIAKAVTEFLGENIDEDTVRKWLKLASEQFPPKK